MIPEVKEAIINHSNIQILPSPKSERDSLVAALALFYSLKKLEKNVNLLFEKIPERFKFLIKKDEAFLPEADFLISIEERSKRISQIFYQKTENKLNLFLKTEGNNLKKEDINLQALNSKILLILIGIKSSQQIEIFLKRKRGSFLINLDNQPENENYAQLNLIFPSSSLSEIIFDLLKSFEKDLFDQTISNCLLTGIIQEGFRIAFQEENSSQLKAETFQKIASLIKKGANLQKVISSLYSFPNKSSFQIFRRILAKLEICFEKNLAWVILQEKDFQETNSSPFELSFFLERLNFLIFPFQNFLCLFESRNTPLSSWGIFYSQKKEISEKIAKQFQGEIKGKGTLFSFKEKEFEQIKNTVLKTL